MPDRASLTPKSLAPLLSRLKRANAASLKAFPGGPTGRQPVHTVYGGAHLFKADSARKLGQLALNSLYKFAPEPTVLAAALGIPMELSNTVYVRVREKLKGEAVEDFRIDFEDGYGNRPDAEEDGHAVAAAQEVVKAMQEASLPPFIGIRIKPLSSELAARSLRTLDLFITTMAGRKRRLPKNFAVTLPKVLNTEQVRALAKALEMLEKRTGLPKGSLKIELMVETTRSLFDEEGRAALGKLVRAAAGRCVGAHFGAYDYTADCGITAAYQNMMHPACDFARNMMTVSLAPRGVMLSDSATNVLPVGPHRAGPGETLSPAQIRENFTAVHRAWKLHYNHVRHSLSSGFYQGWDLHPAQLPARYAAVFTFFLEGLAPASARLKNFIAKAAQATLAGDVFDDAATGRGLLNFFLRGLSCGALTEEEAAQAGLTREELQGRSFLKILENRRQKA